MQTITLHEPLDMHLHLRDEEMLKVVAPLSAQTFSGAIVMPNLVPPVTTKEMVIAYKERINQAKQYENFEPYMTLFFQPTYTKAFLEDLRDEITAIKLYPAGITTNSESGVSELSMEELSPTLQAMSDLGIPLCIHGETNGFVMEREAEFMPIYEQIAKHFPDLTIIMEHITTKAAIDTLEKYDNLHATITLHHLLITLDDVAGGMLQPHLFCKPIAKTPTDREALLKAALSGNPRIMFGSDSAPHPQHAKEASGCAAGVFTAPIALAALAGLFEQHTALDNLESFVSLNAQRIYGVTPPTKTITLEKKPMSVPQMYENVVPMYAGQTLQWSVIA
jgi:dihydroorotase